MSTTELTQEKAMYVATKDDWIWLLNEQQKLYTRSWETPEYVFQKLWGLVTDLRNLRNALTKVCQNKGKRTPGVDGVTVRMILEKGSDLFVEGIRQELRSGTYEPQPVRRIQIPKPGKPGQFRALGIPTVKDRVVQAALKNIMEPIFEAGFNPNSYGFRPGKSVHGALEHVRKLLNSGALRASSKTEVKLPYQWAIEGDIKGCFDNINHHELMNRIRAKVADNKVTRLIRAFLTSGVMAEGKFFRTQIGTPQGGILSPLLANIALSAIDKRYERHTWPRTSPTPLTSQAQIKARATGYRCNDKQRGKPVFNCIRYADDFIIFVCAPNGKDQDERAMNLAHEEKDALATYLESTLGLKLSESKTLITRVTQPLGFLGYHARVRWNPKYGWESALLIPKAKSQILRDKIKELFHHKACICSLESRLKQLNHLLRGWGYFYQHAFGAKKVFAAIDRYVWFTIYRWLQKKHSRPSMRKLKAMYGWRKPNSRMIRWRDRSLVPFELASISVHRFKHAWQSQPKFVATSMESPVRIERRTLGSEEGGPKTAV